MKRKAKTLAKLPRLKTDLQAERFVAGSDLTKFDLSTLTATQFEFAAKEARINMRLPSGSSARSSAWRGNEVSLISGSSAKRSSGQSRSPGNE